MIRCVLRCMLEAVDGKLCLLDVLRYRRYVLDVSCGGAGDDAVCANLYAGGCGGELCLLEVLEVMR